MYILNANFSFIKQVGDISPEKLKELKYEFSNYPEIIIQPGQPLVFKKGVSALAVQGDQITFVVEGEPEEIDIKHIIGELSKLNSILNLPSKSFFAFRFEAVENYDLNVMEKSGDNLSNLLTILDAKGLGYRFIIENSKIQGDVYIEPYLKDPNRVFFNVNIQSKSNEIAIEDSQNFVEEHFNFIVNNSKKVADDLYKK